MELGSHPPRVPPVRQTAGGGMTRVRRAHFKRLLFSLTPSSSLLPWVLSLSDEEWNCSLMSLGTKLMSDVGDRPEQALLRRMVLKLETLRRKNGSTRDSFPRTLLPEDARPWRSMHRWGGEGRVPPAWGGLQDLEAAENLHAPPPPGPLTAAPARAVCATCLTH